MAITTPNASHVAQDLSGLYTELSRFSSAAILARGLEYYEGICSNSPPELNNGMYSLVHGVLLGANNVIEQFTPADTVPQHILTRLAVKAALDPNTPDIHPYACDLCLAAELKLMESLESDEGLQVGPESGAPARILLDVNGEPFAYKKSVGDSVALALREAEVTSLEGTRLIPAGAFFGFGGSELNDNANSYIADDSGHELSALGRYSSPSFVKLVRFSAYVLSREIAESVYQSATRPPGYSYLRRYITAALNQGLEGIAERVQTLYERGDADFMS